MSDIDVHWLEVDKETGEVYRFFVTEYGAPKYDSDSNLAMVPCHAEDMLDVPALKGQIYNFETGKTEDSDISWNYKLEIQLEQTDWMVIRHRDQLDLMVTPSMSPDEYRELLQWRESLRRDMR